MNWKPAGCVTPPIPYAVITGTLVGLIVSMGGGPTLTEKVENTVTKDQNLVDLSVPAYFTWGKRLRNRRSFHASTSVDQ